MLWKAAESHGYEAEVTWGSAESPELLEMCVLDRSRINHVSHGISPPAYVIKPWTAYADDPHESSLRQQLIPQLREYLKEHLPEHMTPVAWVVLKQLPLTS